jgi:septal ring factor EnvC (AmiA/AmiB activator)
VLTVTFTIFAQVVDRIPPDSTGDRAARRMRTLQQEAERLATEERTLINDLRRLELEREMRVEEASQAAARSSAVATELAAVGAQIERLDQERVAAQPELRGRLVELYKLGQARYVRLFLSVADIRRVGQASRLVATLAAQDRERIQSHTARLTELENARRTLEARARELADARMSGERARAAADRAVAARNARIKEIDSQRDSNAQLSSELQAAQQRLQGTVRGLPAAGGADAALPLRPFRGDLDWPAMGPLRQRFGVRTPSGDASNGVEITAAEGTPAHAIHEGVVAFAAPFTGFGNLVILDHGGQSFSLYGNLLDLAVTPEQRVVRGDVVGRVGPAIAGAIGAGLYFELRVDGRAVDPVEWLKKH